MSDGPSDEEGSRSYNDNEEHIGDVREEDIQHIDDVPPPPPTSTPPIYKQQRSTRNRTTTNHKDNTDVLPNYPMTIEVKTEVPAPRSSRILNNNGKSNTYDNKDQEDDAAEYSEDDESQSRRDNSSLTKQQQQPPTKYESFPAHSVSASHTDSPSIQSRSVASTTNNKKQSSRGQVLVHYHPQLGDEGYESTLLDSENNKYSRVSKAINTATSSRNSTSRYSSDNSNKRDIRPPKHIYPTRGMHTRAIDDERHESYLKGSSPSSSNKPSYSPDGNDEYNNAATRQIRRRVFRVAMERGVHDERRKKLLDADADVGGPSLNTKSLSPRFPKSPGSTSNGYQQKQTQSFADDHAGDMPLTPGTSTTPKSTAQQPSLIFSPVSQDPPPSPPSQPPSYKTLVYNLIAANEPEKLVQIDRVMEKYVDREEELIKKLDLRYRRRRMKKNAMSEGDDKEDTDGGVGSKDKSSAASLPQQPVLTNDSTIETKGSHEEKEDHLPMMEIKTETTSTPTKLTFIKLDGTPTKSPGVEEKGTIFTPPTLAKPEGGEEEDGGDELMMPPQISKRTLPPSITDSTISPTKTKSLATATGGSSSVMSATMASLGEDDDDVNSGMIPTIAPSNKQSIATTNITTANVKNLGNQVVNERLMREREERGKVKETLIERVTSTQYNNKLSPPPSPSNNKLKTISSSSPPSTPGKQQEQLDTIGDSSPTKQLQNPYHLKQCQSYGDGISVITMETKSTQLQHQKSPAVNADGEAVYNFDEMMKRPPKNITLESSFSGSNDAGEESKTTKKSTPERLQRVIPEAVESPDEKAQAEKASLEGSAKLDDVEARIRARQKSREGDAKNKALAKADENRVAAQAVEQGVVAETNESLPKVKVLDEDVADPYIIEGVLSSFDEDDQKPKPPQDERKIQTPTSPTIIEEEPQQQEVLNTSILTDSTAGTPSRYSSTAEEAIAAATRSELQRQKEVAEYKQQHERDTSAASALTSEDLEEEIARLIAEKESRIQAEKAVALMKAQRELEEERKARAEAEAARIKAEEELQRLRLGQAASISSKEEAIVENEITEEEPSLDQARFEQEQQRIKLEQMAVEAESARVKAEEDLEQLRLSRSTKDAVEVARSAEEDDDAKNEVARDLDQERLEAEATRLKAEKDLEKLEAEREMTISVEASQDDKPSQSLPEQQPLSYAAITKDDEVEKFRLGYSSDENDDIQLKPTTEESVLSMPDDETAGGKLPPPDHKLVVSTPDDENEGGLQDKPDEVKRSSPELEEPPTISRSIEKEEVPSTPVEKEESDEAQIHHVARVTFEGDTSKGQLSFITGAKVEAHSNQRGPWWLGRCGGRTGWFPASAVVPADEFLSPTSTIQTDQDESEEMKKLSGDELNAVYDLIRNPSDDDEDNDSEEGSSSPAKSRWLDDGAPKSPPTRVDSPPIDRMDPSEMAGLSQRLYDSQDEGSRSNQNDVRSPTPVASVGSLSISTEPAQSGEADETLSKDEPKPAQEASSDTVDQTRLVVEESSQANTKPQSTAVTTTKQPEWRAVKDPKTGLVYYYNTATRETTWERPSDYVEKKAPLSPRSTTSKSKGKSRSKGKGIIGFITKRGKKNKSVEAETGVAAAATSNTSKDIKSQAESTEQKSATEESQENVAAAAAVVESKDGWLTLDDEISRSDSEDSDSDETEATATSIFSKTKLKDRLNLFAEKIGKKLNSPSNEPAYSTFDGGTKQEKDADNSNSVAQEGSNEVVAADNSATSTSKQVYASDTTSKSDNIQPVEVSNPEWRSAVDGESGREYYYIKGSTKVTWQRPPGL